MHPSIDIHVATPDERAEAFDNLHEQWGRGLDRASHLQWRLQRPKHTNAVWYVGCVAGRVVAGCGAYRLPLSLDGQVVPACGIGEVHTLPEYRGQGIASQLLPRVEQDQHQRGTAVSLLFSDIAPGFYQRLGYQAAPSHFGWMSPTGLAVESPLQLVPFAPDQHVAQLADLYQRYHAELPLYVARDAAYWEFLLKHEADDHFLWVHSAEGRTLGYVRVNVSGAQAKLRDLALGDSSITDGDDETLFATLMALVRWSQTLDITRLGGWLPMSPVYGRLFNFEPRDEEITMFKSLRPELVLTAEQIAAADYLHEIDHV